MLSPERKKYSRAVKRQTAFLKLRKAENHENKGGEGWINGKKRN